MKDRDLAMFSMNDVLHTLRECERDEVRYGHAFEHMLAFASELTGLSEDALAGMMSEEQKNEGPEVKAEDLKVGMVGNIRDLPELKKALRGKAFEVVDFSQDGVYPIVKIEGMDGTYSAFVGHLENVHMPLSAKLENATDKAGVVNGTEKNNDFVME